MVPKVSSKLVSLVAFYNFVIVFHFVFFFVFFFSFVSFFFWVGLTFIICYITIVQNLLCQHKSIVVKYFDLFLVFFFFWFRSVLISLTVSRTGLLYLLIRQLHFVTDFVICGFVSKCDCVCVRVCYLLLLFICFIRFLNFYKVIFAFFLFWFWVTAFWDCFVILWLKCGFKTLFQLRVWQVSLYQVLVKHIISSQNWIFHHLFCLTPKNNETF